MTDHPTTEVTDASWSIGRYTNDELEAMTSEEYEEARAEAESEDEWQVDTVELTLLAVPDENLPESHRGEALNDAAEEVVTAAFEAAHRVLEEAEGFKRYGDIMPGEFVNLQRLGSLILRSVLSNGRMP